MEQDRSAVGETAMNKEDAHTHKGTDGRTDEHTDAQTYADVATDLCCVHDQLSGVDRKALTAEQEARLQEAASHINSVSVELFAR